VRLDDERFESLLEARATHPERVEELAARRPRRPLLSGDGRVFLVAADHTARGALGAGGHPMAMADRRSLLDRLLLALDHPGVDGVLGTPDIVEDLLLLGALDGKVVFGSMNRGGLAGAIWELADPVTAYDPDAIVRSNLDGGKVLLRIDDDDPGTLATLQTCAGAITALAQRRLVAMVEPLPYTKGDDGRARIDLDPDRLARAAAVAAGLGATSAYTWLKLPATGGAERAMRATTLPVLLLGGDPGADAPATFAAWERAMAEPNVRGLVAGRALLYPTDGDVAGAVDAAARIAHATAGAPR
jgi:hypothetical protein